MEVCFWPQANKTKESKRKLCTYNKTKLSFVFYKCGKYIQHKGQVISERNFVVLDFPKKQHFFLKLGPIKKILTQFYANLWLFMI